MFWDFLLQEEETDIGALPDIPGASWHVRYRGGERLIELDVPARVPIRIRHSSLQMVQTEVSVALTLERGRFVFRMTSPDPGSVSLPNWLPGGEFVSPSTDALIRAPGCRLEDALQPVLRSLRLEPDEQLQSEAVNRNALAWLTAQQAFAAPEPPAPPPSGQNSERSITMRHRRRDPGTPPQPPVRHTMTFTPVQQENSARWAPPPYEAGGIPPEREEIPGGTFASEPWRIPDDFPLDPEG